MQQIVNRIIFMLLLELIGLPLERMGNATSQARIQVGKLASDKAKMQHSKEAAQ